MRQECGRTVVSVVGVLSLWSVGVSVALMATEQVRNGEAVCE